MPTNCYSLPILKVEYITLEKLLIETFIVFIILSSEFWTMMMCPDSLNDVERLVVIV